MSRLIRFIKMSVGELTLFGKILWAVSAVLVTVAFFVGGAKDPLTLVASLIGVTSLVFIARGMLVGQALCIVFSVFYGIISLYCRYYGEMITYLGMTAPMSVFAIISWARHPYEGTAEVTVATPKGWVFVGVGAASVAVTVAFYFILDFFGAANLIVSTVSVTTSFFAVALMYFRTPWYAAAYAANDVVLIVLWVMAAIEDPSYWSMVICFSVFFVNDIYCFVSWLRMQRKQAEK